MASPFGPLVKEQPYISTIPFDLIAQVGQQKQGLYNQAIAQGQQQLDLMANQELYRGSDIDYINNKVKEATDKLNEFAGLDLSKRNIQNQLNGAVSDAFGDPEFTRRIIANKKYGQAQAFFQDIEKNHPELYSDTNYKLYQDQVNSWMNNPDQIDFNAKYTPYYDSSKKLDAVGKEILDHPDVYQIDASINGLNATQEVKQVAADKLLQGYKSAIMNDGQALGQYRIDYEATKDLRTPDMAQKLLNGQISVQNALISNAQTVLNNGESDQATKDKATKQIEASNSLIKTLNDEKTYITQTGDVSGVYTFDNYLENRLANKADALAFTQKGIPKVSDISKLQYQRETAMLSTQWKEEADARKEAAKNQADFDKVYNQLLNDQKTLMLNGSVTMRSPEIQSLFAVTGSKINDDGSFGMSFSGKTLNFAPVTGSDNLDNSLYNVQLYSDADKLLKSAQDKFVEEKAKDFFDKNPGLIKSKNKSYTESMSDYLGLDKVRNKFYDQFKSTDIYTNLANNLKDKYGVDIRNNTVNGVPITEDMKAKSELLSKLSLGIKNLSLSVNFVPNSENNVQIDSKGNTWVSGSTTMTKRQLINGLDKANNSGSEAGWFTDSDNKAAVDKMIDQGLIVRTKDVDGEDNDEYSVPLNIKTDLNPEQAQDKYVRSQLFTGDKATAVDVPVYMSNANQVISNYKSTLQRTGNPSNKNFGDFLNFADHSNIGTDNYKDGREAVQGALKSYRIESQTPLNNDGKPGTLSNLWATDMDKASKQNLTNLLIKAWVRSKNPEVSEDDRVKALQVLAAYKNAKTTSDFLNADKQLKGQPIITGLPDLSSKLQVNVKGLKDNLPKEYKAWIDKYAQEYNVPANIIQAIMFKESSYNPTKTNDSGHMGLGQFDKETARQYGVTDRTSPEQSIKGIAWMLKDAYDKTGDWDLATTAHIAGVNGSTKLGTNASSWGPNTREYLAAVKYYENQLNSI